MSGDVSEYLATNIRELREASGLSQQQIAIAAEIPRPTWANLESGQANPTVAVLTKVAGVLNVGVERLLSPPARSTYLHRADTLPEETREGVKLRRLIPKRMGGLQLSRLSIPVGARLSGDAHPRSSQAAITCERGELELSIAAESFRLKAGDVLLFNADQSHEYRNAGRQNVVAYSLLSVGAPR